MKFLLNMNIPRIFGEKLTQLGFECTHIGDRNMAKSPDYEIVEIARNKKEVIITNDLDYGHLLAISGMSSPSVIIFRLRNNHTENMFECFTRAWSSIEGALENGAIIILDDHVMRIRKLPIPS